MVKYSKNKALRAQRSASIKSAKVAVGTKLTIVEVIALDSADENLNRDELLCVKPDGSRVRIPIREFMNMKVADGGKLYNDAEEDGDIAFPMAITIVDSADRTTDRTGETQKIYPIQSYVAGAAQIVARVFDFDALLASGLKPDNTLDPVQDYTISAEF